jgi:hypothetical protein
MTALRRCPTKAPAPQVAACRCRAARPQCRGPGACSRASRSRHGRPASALCAWGSLVRCVLGDRLCIEGGGGGGGGKGWSGVEWSVAFLFNRSRARGGGDHPVRKLPLFKPHPPCCLSLSRAPAQPVPTAPALPAAGTRPLPRVAGGPRLPPLPHNAAAGARRTVWAPSAQRRGAAQPARHGGRRGNRHPVHPLLHAAVPQQWRPGGCTGRGPGSVGGAARRRRRPAGQRVVGRAGWHPGCCWLRAWPLAPAPAGRRRRRQRAGGGPLPPLPLRVQCLHGARCVVGGAAGAWGGRRDAARRDRQRASRAALRAQGSAARTRECG